MKHNRIIQFFNYSGQMVEELDEASCAVGFSFSVNEDGGIPRAILRK